MPTYVVPNLTAALEKTHALSLVLQKRQTQEQGPENMEFRFTPLLANFARKLLIFKSIHTIPKCVTIIQ